MFCKIFSIKDTLETFCLWGGEEEGSGKRRGKRGGGGRGGEMKMLNMYIIFKINVDFNPAHIPLPQDCPPTFLANQQ